MLIGLRRRATHLVLEVQRITRYPLLIKQVLHYSEANEERAQIEAALEISEKVLHHINETIREQEGTERLRTISHNLWIGEGYVAVLDIKVHILTIMAAVLI